MEEIILSRETIYEGRIVKLDRLEVQLPNGKTAQRDVIRHPGAAAVVALDDAQQLLMVRQFRMAAGRVLLEIPAGTLEPDEAPIVCAERELQEEAGMKPGKLQSLGGIFVAPGYTSEFIHLFLATDLVPSQLTQDDDEFLEVERVTMAQALALIDSGEICDAKSVTGILRASRLLEI